MFAERQPGAEGARMHSPGAGGRRCRSLGLEVGEGPAGRWEALHRGLEGGQGPWRSQLKGEVRSGLSGHEGGPSDPL